MSKTELNKETMRLNLPPAKLPKPRKQPISSAGIIIRDGSNVKMRRVPNFDQLLKDMTENRAQVILPERYTFLPVQSVAYHDLLRQQQFSAPTFTPGTGAMQGIQGIPGIPGIPGHPGAKGDKGDTGATGGNAPPAGGNSGPPANISNEPASSTEDGNTPPAGLPPAILLGAPPPLPDPALGMRQVLADLR